MPSTRKQRNELRQLLPDLKPYGARIRLTLPPCVATETPLPPDLNERLERLAPVLRDAVTFVARAKE